MFNGLGMNMGNLSRLSNAQTRSISPENFTGEKGKGGMSTDGPALKNAQRAGLGQGWKISLHNNSAGRDGSSRRHKGMGAIQHIWMTLAGYYRFAILRMYWDDSEKPSVECPVGDFFCDPQPGDFRQLTSLAVCVNPGSAINCYWEMPFRKRAYITIENISDKEMTLFYQIDYCLTEVPDDCAYFHAQFRRVNPLPYKEVYTILDNVRGKGHYVGTYMFWASTTTGLVGRGRNQVLPLTATRNSPPSAAQAQRTISAAPTLRGEQPVRRVPHPTRVCTRSKARRSEHYPAEASMYRWHIADPIRFEKDIKVTIQALGWRKGGAYLPFRTIFPPSRSVSDPPRARIPQAPRQRLS